MKKLMSITAAMMLAGGLVSAPAFAAGSAPAAAKPAAKTMAHKTMHKAVHKASCYDYAWQSQAMKDCLAKGDKPMKMKKSMKKKAKKAS